MTVFNVPNSLTILRIALTFIFIFLLFTRGLPGKACALAVFLAACLTDALDGFIAKRNNQVTDFGKLMDPIADKILVLSAFISFVGMKLVHPWMVAIIILREVAVTGLRALALTKGELIAADGPAKNKTALQLFTIFAILLFIIFEEGSALTFRFWTPAVEANYKTFIDILMLIVVIMTVRSGFSYFIKNRTVYSGEK